MAYFTVTYFSEALFRKVTMQAIIPGDIPGEFGSDGNEAKPKDNKKYPTLVLLHGLMDQGGTEWLCKTDIEDLANQYQFAVLMPNGENSFYVPGLAPNSDYGRLVGQEVLEVGRKYFPLSDKREETYIAGVSMGGFGAIRNGLKYADNFSKILSFSAAIHMFEFKPGDGNVLRHMLRNEDQVMGDYNSAVLTEKNPAVCLEHLKSRVESGECQYPAVYMICGLDEDLLHANRSFKKKLEDAGVPLIYEEQPGAHNFAFWKQHLPKMIEWAFRK